MTSPYVTDPKLLAQLEGDGYVSDPALLAQLEGTPKRTYPGLHAESSAPSPAYQEPSFMDSVINGLKSAGRETVGIGENALSIGAGIPAALAGGIGYATGLTTGDPGFASEMQQKLGGWAYQPKTDSGKAWQSAIGNVVGAPSRLSQAVADKDFERNNAQGDPAAALKATALRVAPEALMMVLGGKMAADRVGPVKPKLNLNDKPAGLGALLTGNVEKIAGNNVRAIAGPQGAREQLVTALVSNKPPVRGFPMTAADAVRGTDAGTTIQALQERVARSVTNEPGNPLGVSQQFERKLREQKAAIAAAEDQRNVLTAPMREAAIQGSRAQNTAAQQSLAAADSLFGLGKDISQTLRAERVPAGRDALGTPLYGGANLDAAGIQALEAAKKSAVSAAKKEMSNPAIGKAVKGDSMTSVIRSMIKDPQVYGSTFAKNALDNLKSKINSLVDENGIVDPEAAYQVRKELGMNINNAAEAAAGNRGKWDRSLTAKLESGVQKAFDDAMNNATGGKWSPYLNTFSRLSKKIEKAQDMVDNKYSVNQKSDVASVHGQAENSAMHFPPLLSRTANLSRFLLESRRKGLEGKIASKQAEWLQNPSLLAAELQKGISPQDQMIAARLAALREARLKALAAGTGAGATQTQENR